MTQGGGRHRKRGHGTAFLGGGLILTATAAVAWFALTSGHDPVPAPSPTASAALPAPSPEDSPDASSRPEVVDVAPRPVVGKRLTLRIQNFREAPGQCAGHVFHTTVIFWSDCSDWRAAGYDIYFFYVEIRNRSRAPVKVWLDHFQMQARETGQRSVPEDLTSRARNPEAFFPVFTTLRAGATRAGYMVFDASIDFVPAELRYTDGDQTLTTRIVGKQQLT